MSDHGPEGARDAESAGAEDGAQIKRAEPEAGEPASRAVDTSAATEPNPGAGDILTAGDSPDNEDESDRTEEAAKPSTKSKKKAALEKASKLVGRVISDRYIVEEVLAAGGMGC